MTNYTGNANDITSHILDPVYFYIRPKWLLNFILKYQTASILLNIVLAIIRLEMAYSNIWTGLKSS